MHSRYKPTGWRHEGYRHSLAAKGIKTRLQVVQSIRRGLRSARAEESRRQAQQLQDLRRGTKGTIPVTVGELTASQRTKLEAEKLKATLSPRERRGEIVIGLFNRGVQSGKVKPIDGEPLGRYIERVNVYFGEEGIPKDTKVIGRVFNPKTGTSGLSQTDVESLVRDMIVDRYGLRDPSTSSGAMSGAAVFVYDEVKKRFLPEEEYDRVQEERASSVTSQERRLNEEAGQEAEQVSVRRSQMQVQKSKKVEEEDPFLLL